MAHRCSGCNSCNLQKQARIPLAPRQLDYLRDSGLILRFNETVAKPVGRRPAKLTPTSLVLGRAQHISLFIDLVETADWERIEVKGIRHTLINFIKSKVFTYPCGELDGEQLRQSISSLSR